jgi:5-hydroxyisourate hydrolase
MSGGISTHILDTAAGRPAANVTVALFQGEREIASGTTDGNGRCAALLPEHLELEAGTYRLRFDVGAYFPASFYPEVNITFMVRDAKQHYHVPLLISPFGYTTYRGS